MWHILAQDSDDMLETNSAGIVLAYYRNKYHLTLEQVCDGICSVSKLSRMEKGIRGVDSLTSSLLLERIGKEVCQFEQLLNDEDYALWRARESIRKNMRQKEYGRVREQLSIYRAMKNSASNLHEQFCLYQEIVMILEKLKDSENAQAELCETALRALHLTKPLFVFGDSEKMQLYTSTEIELILIVVCYGEYRTNIQAEDVLLDLFHHVAYFYTERRKQKLGYLILIQLIRLEQRLHDQEKELSYIDKGINFIAQGREIAGLDRLHFLRARALMRRCGAAVSEDNVQRHALRQEIQKECLMAYSICEVFGDVWQMREIEQFCEEELGWQITRLEM